LEESVTSEETTNRLILSSILPQIAGGLISISLIRLWEAVANFFYSGTLTVGS